MTQLLQLHSDLPDQFPSHERRLHVFVCRRKACRRKEGSIRAIRSVRATLSPKAPNAEIPTLMPTPPSINHGLGNDVFGVARKPIAEPKVNPFSTTREAVRMPPTGIQSNPRLTIDISSTASDRQPNRMDKLPATFTQKLSLSTISSASGVESRVKPWPAASSMPDAFPLYHLEAEYESLDDLSSSSVNLKPTTDLDDLLLDNDTTPKEDAETFESTVDKTFQRFADRLAQNPQQILRYEFGGSPLLYSKTDGVGKLFTQLDTHASESSKATTMGKQRSVGIPTCPNCGQGRVFEMQITPHAIAEVEVEETGLEGMDWGTLIIGVCRDDCQLRDVSPDEVGHMEEWVGVQWEEKRT